MKLREFLNKNPLTVVELSRKLGVSRQIIYSWMNGTCEPRVSQALKIESLTGGAVTAKDWP